MKILAIISLCTLFLRPASYAQDEDKNYTLSYRPRQGFTNAGDVHRYTSPEEVQKTITYTDGVGRTTQSILLKGSPDQQDIVQNYEYDRLGRSSRQYLPYENRGTGGVNAYHRDSKPYSLVEYEPSPLGRKRSVIGPGEAWHEADRRRHYVYRTNHSGDAVRKMDVAANASLSSVPTLLGTYGDGQLSVVESFDEDGVRTVVYTNKAGQTVMQKVQKPEGGWLYTYHVYDVFGNLRFTLPPKAVAKIGDTFSGNAYVATLAALAFQYVYDEQQRLIYEKAPGVAPVVMIYDRLDRLRLSQNGAQAQQDQWSFIKYDRFGRPMMTGSYTTSLSRDALIAEVNKKGFHEERGSSPMGYSFHQSFPAVLDDDLRTLTYYDDYAFIDYSGWDQEGHDYRYDGENQFQRPVGQVTGTKTKIIGTTQWLNSVSYYNYRYEVIGVISENHQGGVDKVVNHYDFSGNLTKSEHRHNDDLTIVEEYAYDHGDRLRSIAHRVNDEPTVKLV